MKRYTMTLKGIALAAVLPLLALPATGCDDGSDPVDPGTARLRVMHLSPDAPAVDIWVDSSLRAVEGLSFNEGTGYLNVNAGTYDFAVSPAGGMASDSVLEVTGVPLQAERSYTVVAFDELSGIKALLLEDDESSLAAGEIRIRAIHTAAAVGEVDIWVLPEAGTPSPLYENVGFGAAGGYLDLPAGSYTIGFDVDNDANPDVIFDLPDLSAGTVANVFAVSDASGAIYLLAQLANGTVARVDPRPSTPQAEIRVLHLSPDAPAVDVYAGGETQVVDNLGFGEGTGYLSVDEGTYSFQITAAGGMPSEAVLNVSDLDLMGNASYTAVAYGNLENIAALALEDDYADLAPGDIRVRAIHTAAGIGTVDIWEISDGLSPLPLYTGVGFGQVGNYLDLPAGAYSLGFDLDADGQPEVAFNIPALPEGTVANVFAVRDSMGDVFLLAQLNDGTIARIDASDPPAWVRVLHLSRDTPAVDVYAGESTRAFAGLDFSQSTGYAALPPGTYTFNVTAAEASPTMPALTISDLPIGSNTFYTAVAFDDFSGIQALALVDDYADVPAGDIRIRAIHTAVGVGQVDIWEVSDLNNPVPLYVDFDFGAVGTYFDLPAMGYKLGFDLDNDASPDVTFDVPDLPAGTVANVFAVTDANDAVFLLAQLADGTTVRINPAQ